jgi:hypothetical protein
VSYIEWGLEDPSKSYFHWEFLGARELANGKQAVLDRGYVVVVVVVVVDDDDAIFGITYMQLFVFHNFIIICFSVSLGDVNTHISN